MATFTITPNMGLILPIPGEDPGPDYANNQYSSGLILDGHTHANGSGVPITPTAININSDLPMNGNNLTLVNTVRYNNLSSTIAGSSPNIACTYFAQNEFYANDGAGNIVQITKTGSVNATSSGISSGTASASFSGGVLVVNANTNTPANVQGASFLFGNNVVSSKFITLSAPNSLGANINETLPPNNSTGATAFMTYDASNNMGIGPAVTGGITLNNLASKSSGSSVGVGGIAISSGSGTFTSNSTIPANVTNLSVTIVTTGRPVQVSLQPLAGSTGSYIEMGTNASSGSAIGFISFLKNASVLVTQDVGIKSDLDVVGHNEVFYSPGSFNLLDLSVLGSAGTYTYTIQAFINQVGNDTIIFNDVVLTAYELS